ncbi:MAG: serine hydrolase, partial [Sphingobacterium sp.]
TYAKGYDFRNGNYTQLPFYLPGSNGASSALVSNASDMTKFLHYLLNTNNYGKVGVLSEKYIAEMERVHSTLASQNGLKTGYALGNDFFPNNKKITLRGHNGKGEGFSSWIFFNREAGLAYAISTNCNVNLWPVSQEIEDFLTKDINPPVLNSVMIDQAEIEPMLGYYKFMNPKNERWEFFKRIFSGINLLSIDKDKLVVDKGDGEIDSLIHMGNGLFRLKGDIVASCVIGLDHNGKPFFQGYGNGFYNKVSYGPILFQKMLIYLGLIAAFMSVVYTIVGIPLFLFRKLKAIDFGIICLPAIGTISIILAYRKMGLTDAVNKELFTTLNPTSFSIFAGMLFFGISVVLGAYLLYKRRSQIQGWVKFPLAFNIIFLFYLVVLLSINGWIGVPIWLM